MYIKTEQARFFIVNVKKPELSKSLIWSLSDRASKIPVCSLLLLESP